MTLALQDGRTLEYRQNPEPIRWGSPGQESPLTGGHTQGSASTPTDGRAGKTGPREDVEVEVSERLTDEILESS